MYPAILTEFFARAINGHEGGKLTQFIDGNIWKICVLLWSTTLRSCSYTEKVNVLQVTGLPFCYEVTPLSQRWRDVILKVPCVEIHDASDRCASEKASEIK
jgi:hypothetical protein